MYEYVITAGPGIMLEHGVADATSIFMLLYHLQPLDIEMITSSAHDAEPGRFH